MVKVASSERTLISVRSMDETRRETERMQDIMLLLQHLNAQEETTIKMILDCLYDVASVNLINQKFQNRRLNRFLKAIAWMPKPAFRIFAMRWFKKNSPRLITRWLYNKVSFKPPAPPSAPVVPSSAPVIAEAQASAITLAGTPVSDLITTEATVAERDRQIRYLRSQVRVLTGLLVGVVVLLGGALVLPHSSGAGLIGPMSGESSHR